MVFLYFVHELGILTPVTLNQLTRRNVWRLESIVRSMPKN